MSKLEPVTLRLRGDNPGCSKIRWRSDAPHNCRSLQRRNALAAVLVLALFSTLPSPVLGMVGERFVVVGGGVCGVTCSQTLASAVEQAHAAASDPDAAAKGRVTLVAAAGLLKGVANVVRLSRHLDSFEVQHLLE